MILFIHPCVALRAPRDARMWTRWLVLPSLVSIAFTLVSNITVDMAALRGSGIRERGTCRGTPARAPRGQNYKIWPSKPPNQAPALLVTAGFGPFLIFDHAVPAPGRPGASRAQRVATIVLWTFSENTSGQVWKPLAPKNTKAPP